MHSVTLSINFLASVWPLLLGSVESVPAKKHMGAQWPVNYDFDYDNDDVDFEDNSHLPHHLLAELPLNHPLLSEAFGRLGPQKLSNRTPPQPDRSLITKNSVAVWANELKQDMDKQIRDLTSKQTNVYGGNSLVRYMADFINYAYNYLANLYQNIVNNLDKYGVEKLMEMYDLEKKTYMSLKEMIALFNSILSTPNSAVPAPTDLKKKPSSIEEIIQKNRSESGSYTTKPRNSKKRQKKLAFTRPKNPHTGSNIAWSYYDEFYAPYK